MDNKSEFIKNLEKALINKTNESIQNYLFQQAEENSWDFRAKTLDKYIMAHTHQKIITEKNNITCLEVRILHQKNVIYALSNTKIFKLFNFVKNYKSKFKKIFRRHNE